MTDPLLHSLADQWLNERGVYRCVALVLLLQQMKDVGEKTQGRRNDRGNPYLSSCCYFKRINDLRVVTNFAKEPFLTTELCVG